MKDKELLYDHYKDTCEINRSMIKNRNKFFVYLILIITFHFLLMVEPNSILQVLSSVLANKYNLNIQFSVSIIQSLIWIVLLYVTIRYYQETINIEQQYKYIHMMEKELNKKSKLKIDREGKNYLSDYPVVKDMIHFIYQYIFPIIYLCLIIIKIVNELYNSGLTFCTFLDGVICDICVCLTIAYIVYLWKKD